MRLNVVGIEHVVYVALVVRLGLGGVVVLPVTVGDELRGALSALAFSHLRGCLQRIRQARSNLMT